MSKKAQEKDQGSKDQGTDDQGTSAMKTRLDELLEENIQRRLHLKELNEKVATMQPIVDAYNEEQEAAKTETQKLIEKNEALQGKVNELQVQLDQANRRQVLTGLVAEMGIDQGVLNLIDLSKLDIDDLDQTKAALSVLTRSQRGSTQVRGNTARSEKITMTDLANMSPEDIAANWGEISGK